ncbi:MAG: hypothetical protein CL867_07425 [Cytophagaceae bacterium]|nr:hypothetical protein [Cytophagaceae bacterium]
MKEAINKAIAKAMMEPVKQARENSVFSNSGRVFLDAAAITYDASVSDGKLIDASGKVMDESSPEYKAIVNMAKKQARAQSSIGSDLIGS